MRKGLLFETARAAALVSLGWIALGDMLTRTTHAAEPAGPDTSDRGPSDRSNPARVLLDEFWLLAWDTPFTLHQSGMTLEPTDRSGQWDVIVHEGFDVIARGSYTELLRLRIPQPGQRAVAAAPRPAARQDTRLRFDHFVTAGVVEGSTGFRRPVYGIAYRVVLGPDPIVVEGMTPLGHSTDAGTALTRAGEVYNLLTAAEPDPPDGDYPADPCHCDELYDNDIVSCAADAVGCEAACAAAALAALVGCMALGPLLPACIATVLTAEVLCMASCLARQRACHLRAHNDWIKCQQDCDDE